MFLFLSPLPFLASPFFTFSFSVSLFFFSFFLPSCLSFLLPFCFLFLSLFSFSFFFAFVSWKEQHQNIQLESFSSSIRSHFCWFPLLLFSYKFLFLIFAFFLILSFVFCSTSVFGFKERKFKKHICSKNMGVQHNGFFINLCFCRMWKVIVFFWQFFANFSWFSTEHCKNRYFSTFFKATIYKKKCHFWKLLSGPSWKLLSGPSWVRLKKRQLGPDNNFQIFCAQFFPKQMCWNPYFYSVFWQSVF